MLCFWVQGLHLNLEIRKIGRFEGLRGGIHQGFRREVRSGKGSREELPRKERSA